MDMPLKSQEIIVQLPKMIYEQSILSKENLKIKGKYLERCGILVGKRESPHLIVISDLIEDLSPLEQAPFLVYRETSHIYPQLIKKMQINPSVDYLGEWHTHPNGPNCASLIDHLSMMSMVNNPEYGEIAWVILLVFLPKREILAFYYENQQQNKAQCVIV